jgi:tubulin monoglycylase TTLL3/8
MDEDNTTPIREQALDGEKNIWIVKPGANARGVGIQTFDNLTSLLTYTNESRAIHSSFIVQKYIENPLLINKKKFDIRQFVLVTGLDPLTVFIREDAYLRFSSKDFDLENVADR